ncbi:nascent polypeptide-associated complex protein [Candidatus Micrarchaeota archaeon]|nr:nascent polypeptide-associated complex protein [Candidatus Micrarchaeota archaeon]
MIPGGMDPKKMQALMKQMGIRSEEIEALKVTIETPSGSSIIIEEPQVTKITMQGQASFQIAGNVRVEEKAPADDIKMVMEQTGCNEEDAKAALEKSGGDIAQAIVSLGEGKE